jgi:hypothetical protein
MAQTRSVPKDDDKPPAIAYCLPKAVGGRPKAELFAGVAWRTAPAFALWGAERQS